MKDYEDKEYEIKINEFFDSYDKYINEDVIPEALAFYLSQAYKYDTLSNIPISRHLNSALDTFNSTCEINEIMSKIEEILENKYQLKIENKEESKLIEINK